jgi:hypothetical protein
VLRQGKPLTWDQIFDVWELVEADFSSEFHLELEDEFRRRSWRWFASKINGLLTSPTSRLTRNFSDPPEETHERGISDDGGLDRWQAEAGQI